MDPDEENEEDALVEVSGAPHSQSSPESEKVNKQTPYDEYALVLAFLDP